MKKILKISLYIIVLVSLSLLISLMFREDPGYILLTGSTPLGAFSFESTILTGIFASTLILFVFYFGLRLFALIFNLPFLFKGMIVRYKQHASDKQYARAQLAIFDKKYAKAEDLYVASVKGSIHPRLCYVGAAKAAQLQNSVNRRDYYLSKIDEVNEDRDTAFLADVQRAELLFTGEDYAHAQKALESLIKDQPNNPHILQLLAQSYQRQNKYPELLGLLPKLGRIFNKTEEGKALSTDIYLDLLNYALSQKDYHMLKDIWGNIPKELRLAPNLVIAHSQNLLNMDRPDDGEALLRQALKKHYDEQIMNAYGHLYRGNLNAQIKFAKAQLASHADSAYAHIALARLQLRNENYEEAIRLLDSAIEIKVLPEALLLLAQIKQQQGDVTAALNAYAQIHALDAPNHRIVEGDILPLLNEKAEVTSIEEINEEAAEVEERTQEKA